AGWGGRPARSVPVGSYTRRQQHLGPRQTAAPFRERQEGHLAEATTTQVKILVPGSQPMVALLGQRDELLRLIESAFASHSLVRGNEITISGQGTEAEKVALLFEELLTILEQGHTLTKDSVTKTIDMIKEEQGRPSEVFGDVLLTTRGRTLGPK